MLVFLRYLTVAAVLLAWVLPGQAIADDAAHSDEGDHHGHHGPNIVEFFLGATFEEKNGKNETAFTTGAQYRYAINDTVSVGVLGEYAGSPLDFWVVGVPAVFNIGHSGWQFTTMPAVEFKSSKEKFLFRTGIGYEFEFEGGYSVKPEVNVDWVEGEAIVVTGVNLGLRF
ncbi:MAG: hypothetical protein AAF678_03415 [Pseudomonadota bacterium]